MEDSNQATHSEIMGKLMLMTPAEKASLITVLKVELEMRGIEVTVPTTAANDAIMFLLMTLTTQC